MMIKAFIVFGLATASLTPTAAFAGKPYVGVAIGAAIAEKSKETGGLTSTVPATPDFAAIPSGTSLGLETKNKTGLALSGTAGMRFDNGLRVEVEASFTRNDVRSHKNLAVGGTIIDSVDSAVLTRGLASASNPTVGAVIANGGDGDVKRYGAFANVFYDINRDGNFQPYVGGGIGVQKVDVRYAPSGVVVADASKTRFAYQSIAGATLKLSERFELFGQYTYRGSSRANLPLQLLPGTLGVQSRQSIFTAGLRIPLG
jgi:opacity protein-like surface antigen